jgi:hypothetical protein
LIEGSILATALALVVEGLLCWRARPG